MTRKIFEKEGIICPDSKSIIKVRGNLLTPQISYQLRGVNPLSNQTNIWYNRNFVIIMTGETLSNSALWLGVLANLQFLQDVVPSDFLKSLILVIGPIIGILVSPKAGVVIDRTFKKKVIMWSSLIQLLSACVQVGAMFLQSVPLMISGLLVLNVANSFYLPTLSSVIPLVVRKEDLVRANAVFTNVITLTRITATAVAGLLLTVLPLYGMYLASVILFAIMFGLRYMLQFEESITDTIKKNGKRISFLEVFSLMRTIPALAVIIASGTLFYLFLGGFNLLILKFSEVQYNPALKGILYTVEGIGILIGGYIAKRYLTGGELLRRNVVLLIGVAIGVFIMHYAYSPWLVIIGFAVFGITAGAWLPTNAAIPQLIVPENIRGRYFAFQGMWNRSTFQIALVVTGALLDLLGLPTELLVLSGIIFIGFVFLFLVIQGRSITVHAPTKSNQSAAV